MHVYAKIQSQVLISNIKFDVPTFGQEPISLICERVHAVMVEPTTTSTSGKQYHNYLIQLN